MLLFVVVVVVVVDAVAAAVVVVEGGVLDFFVDEGSDFLFEEIGSLFVVDSSIATILYT